jgi:GTP-binding protein
VIADIPGLIEGASQGAGLGHRFLAHIERTALLLYVIDGGEGAETWSTGLETVRGELGAFRAELLERPAIVVVNKADLLDDAGREEAGVFLDGLGWPAATAVVSAAGGAGLSDLVAALSEVMTQARAAQDALAAARAAEAPVVLRPADERLETFIVEREDDRFVVHGVQLERLFAKADLDNDDALAYLQQVIERAGLNDALSRAGALPGDTVVVGEQEFEFA